MSPSATAEVPDETSGAPEPAQGRSWRLLAYEVSISLLVVVWLALEVARGPRAFLSPMLLVWLVTIAVVDLLPLTLTSKLHFSLSFPLQLAVALIYAPPVAALTAFLGTSDPREFKRELRFTKAVFIRAQIAASVAAESFLFHAASSLDAPWAELASLVVVATIVGYAINVVLVAFYLHLDSGEGTWAIARQMHRGILGELVVSYMGLALFGVIIALFFVDQGILSVLVFVPPLAFARQMMMRTHALKETSEALAEQGSQLADIVENTSDGIFLVGASGDVLTWNPAMERITGITSLDAVGDRVGEFFPGLLADAEVLPVGPDNATIHRDALLKGKGGADRWVRCNIGLVEDPTGEHRSYVVVARDVTSELAAEQLQSNFIAMVSHELRTPLTPIKGLLTSMASGAVGQTEEQRSEFYSIMLRQTDRLERLINDLLDATKLEGSIPLESTSVDLTQLVEEEVGSLREQTATHHFTVDAPGPVFVQADVHRLLQVTGNLMSNAMKYSPPGSRIEVSVERRDLVAMVHVRDHGSGIPETDQDLVFERFHRVDNSSTRQAGGTGLGLFIARRLVDAMGGRIWLRSEVGEGSTFSFSLRLAPAPEQSTAGAPSTSVVLIEAGTSVPS
ncbi:MAG: sensor histidine kinase [Actinomycetota bacterium]